MIGGREREGEGRQRGFVLPNKCHSSCCQKVPASCLSFFLPSFKNPLEGKKAFESPKACRQQKVSLKMCGGKSVTEKPGL